ncbi:hypothetical protein D3C78_887280 [compost metagenome]
MLINILGIPDVEVDGDAIVLRSMEARVSFDGGAWRLVPPIERYQRYDFNGVKVYRFYNKGGSLVVAQDCSWSRKDDFVGGGVGYALFFSKNEAGEYSYLACDWSGCELFSVPVEGSALYLSSNLLAVEGKGGWDVYDMQGQVIERVDGGSQALFCYSLFFFRCDRNERYRIFDPSQQRLTGTIDFAAPLLGVHQLPGGDIFAVDCRGISLLKHQGGEVETKRVFDFEHELDHRYAKASIWRDDRKVYVAINKDYDNQCLVAVDLYQFDNVEVLDWLNDWAVAGRCGFVAGMNYLALKRRSLLADGAIMFWRPEQTLSLDLLTSDISPSVQVSQTASEAKGKHGYRIEVRDESISRAVRTVALEIGRLLSETCGGMYNQAPEIIDKKFDGLFHVEIISASAPDEYERSYLDKYLGFFRSEGGLSPAGSRGRMLALEVVWRDE